MAQVIQHSFAGLSEPSMLTYGGTKISFIGSVIFLCAQKNRFCDAHLIAKLTSWDHV